MDCLDHEFCHIGFVASVWKHVAAASSSREWQMLMMELQYQFRPKLNGVPRLYVYRREKRSGNSYTSPQVFLGPQSCALRHRIYNFAIWLPIRSLSILYQVLNPHAQKYIKLTMDRSQKYDRRCPPQLSHVPQIQAVTFLDRCPIDPRLQCCDYSCCHFCCRLQIRLGRNEILDLLGCTCVLYAEWGFDILDMGCREGESIYRRYRAPSDRMANCKTSPSIRKRASSLTIRPALNSPTRLKAHSNLQSHSPLLQ